MFTGSYLRGLIKDHSSHMSDTLQDGTNDDIKKQREWLMSDKGLLKKNATFSFILSC